MSDSRIIRPEISSSYELTVEEPFKRVRAWTPVNDRPGRVGLFVSDDDDGAKLDMSVDQAEALGTWLVLTAARMRKAVAPPAAL